MRFGKLIAAFIMAFWSFEAHADLTIDLYKELRKSHRNDEKEILQLFVEATYTAMQTTIVRYNGDGYPMAFCPPENKLFTINDIYGFIDSEIAAAKAIRGLPYIGNESVSFVLLNALQAVYPCKSYIRKK